MSGPIFLSDELVEAIAERAAKLVLEDLATLSQSGGGARWLYGAQAAADYLGMPLGKVQKLTAARAIPHHRRNGEQRILYRTDELDEWVVRLYDYEGPPRLRAV
jgi:excisionase family DNA binding protein